MNQSQSYCLDEFDSWQLAFDRSLSGLSENTIQAVWQDVSVLVRWFEAENSEIFSPAKLTNWDLRAFRRWQLNKVRVKAATWNRRLSSLRRFCDWLLKKGLVQIDLLDGVESRKVQRLAPKWLSIESYRRIMRQVERDLNAANTPARAARAKQIMAMMGFMVYAGLRESEMLALRREDLVLRERSGFVLVRAGKGDKERTVALSLEARRLIGPWMELCGDGLLFEMTARTVQIRINDLGKRAGIEGVTPHRLRHTFAKMLIRENVSMEKVAALLGHQNIQTTMRYILPGMDDLQAAVELI